MTVNERARRLTFTDQAKKIVEQMTLKEKLSLIGGKTSMLKMGIDFFGKGYNNKPYHAAGCKRLGVPDLRFCDGPRGVVSGASTCFPVTMLRGATFDPQLEEQVGQVIGREVRANGGNFFGGVCINLPYNPAWGRSQESYGEDTIHLGKMGASLVKGVQSQNIIACLKHYAFNSMENSRFKVNVTASKRTEREIYLKHFKKCIDAGAASIMGAYNLYQGEYCCENSYLMSEVLRKEWDFDGFVISDFVFALHNTEKAANSGLDIEMCNTDKFKPRKLRKLLKTGRFSEDKLDQIALRIVRTVLAYIDNVAPAPSAAVLASKVHTDLARKVAEQGITLLKNNQVLPFAESIRKIAVVGDLANEANIGDHGSSHLKNTPFVVTFTEALAKYYPQIQVTFVPTKEVETKASAIAQADTVLVFAGYRHNNEGEFVNPNGKTNGEFGGDRKSLGLSLIETDMILKSAAANAKTIVVLIGGNMIRVSEWADNVAGILMAFYPGMEGGNAIADILFGRVNPSGKLPFITVRKDEDLPSVKWDATSQHYEYYHGYRKTDKEQLETQYPYGYGLSYTSFALSDFRFVSQVEGQARFTVNIMNTGSRAGAEVAQLYVGYPCSAVERPVKTLADFQKVWLEAGEEKNIQLCVDSEDIAWFDEKQNAFVLENIEYIAYLGTNSDNAAKLSQKFTI